MGDWNDAPSSSGGSVKPGRGRGFRPATSLNSGESRVGANNDDWGNNVSSNTGNNDDWGNSSSKNNVGGNNDDWGSSNNNNSGDNNNDDWGNSGSTDNYRSNNDNDGDNRGGGRGGRGGRGRGGRGRGRGGGRGGRGGRGGGGDRDDSSQASGGKRRRNNDDTEGMDDLDSNNGEEKKAPVTYVPVERNEDDLYTDSVSAGINFSKYNDIKVEVSGDNPLPRAETFDDMNLRVILAENIKKLGYKTPTPIQKHAVPIVKAGRDIMACAQTGSGKTGAYLLPIIQALLENPQEKEIMVNGCAPQVIIMAPTRELVIQIYDVARGFSNGTVIKCCAAYGGVQVSHQVSRLREGAEILVATPGRLNDFVKRGSIAFNAVRFMVLDEADRMLDQGFLPDMKKVLEHRTMVPVGSRQTLMFSATFGNDIQELSAQYMKPDYLFVVVGKVGGVCEDVDQIFYEVSYKGKREKLYNLLSTDHSTEGSIAKTIVFVEKQKTADFIAAFLSEKDFPATSIHGAREQREREQALGDFRKGKMSILVATSVAARGLDIKGVSHVINYDLPKEVDDYVHRIGRTGRVGNRGKATSFFDPKENDNIRGGLCNLFRQSELPIPECLGDGGCSGGFGGSDDFGGQDIRNNAGDAGGNEVEEGW